MIFEGKDLRRCFSGKTHFRYLPLPFVRGLIFFYLILAYWSQNSRYTKLVIWFVSNLHHESTLSALSAMSDTISTTILIEPKPGGYILYRRRFYVLGVFSFLAFNQCAFWLTFSPVSPSTQTFYKISPSAVDLFLNWGPIIFIPSLPLAYLLMNRRNGLRHTVIVLAIACFVATLLRAIPSIVSSSSSPRFRSLSLPFLHAGQIINAACGPLVMAPVSQLSCLWFGANERTRATTFAIMANVFGSTASFLINPAIVFRDTNLPYLLYFHLALATVAGILALVYFPAQPPTAPSAAAQLLMQEEGASSKRNWKVFLTDLRDCMTNPSFVLFSTAGGVMGGTFAVWTGLFSSILAPENYSEQQAGKLPSVRFSMSRLITFFRAKKTTMWLVEDDQQRNLTWHVF